MYAALGGTVTVCQKRRIAGVWGRDYGSGMAIKRYPIHSTCKGSLGEDDDWWELLVDTETDERTVEHTWSHMNPYKGIVTSEGTEIMTVAEFEVGKHGGNLAAAFKRADEDV